MWRKLFIGGLLAAAIVTITKVKPNEETTSEETPVDQVTLLKWIEKQLNRQSIEIKGITKSLRKGELLAVSIFGGAVALAELLLFLEANLPISVSLEYFHFFLFVFAFVGAWLAFKTYRKS